MRPCRLIPNHWYRLSGLRARLWQVGHPRYGTPESVVGWFLGCPAYGTRRWYPFEIHVDGRECGVIFMPEADLRQIRVEDLGLREGTGGPHRPRRPRLRRVRES